MNRTFHVLFLFVVYVISYMPVNGICALAQMLESNQSTETDYGRFKEHKSNESLPDEVRSASGGSSSNIGVWLTSIGVLSLIALNVYIYYHHIKEYYANKNAILANGDEALTSDLAQVTSSLSSHSSNALSTEAHVASPSPRIGQLPALTISSSESRLVRSGSQPSFNSLTTQAIPPSLPMTPVRTPKLVTYLENLAETGLESPTFGTSKTYREFLEAKELVVQHAQ